MAKCGQAVFAFGELTAPRPECHSYPRMTIKSLCVYCGSNSGSRPAYADAARDLGSLLARRGIRLVYGGGRVALMGNHRRCRCLPAAAAKSSALYLNLLLPKRLRTLGLKRPARVVPTMHQRKALMAELADAFVALPGGFGTLEEFAEILTWAQLGLHLKPHGLLNIANFYDPLLAFFDHAVAENFIRQSHRDLVIADPDPARQQDSLATVPPPNLDKWIDKGQT